MIKIHREILEYTTQIRISFFDSMERWLSSNQYDSNPSVS